MPSSRYFMFPKVPIKSNLVVLPSLPISSKCAEIASAIRNHQVVLICGETGSGKSTQIAKICLSIGRGLGMGGKGLIGHTHPRRLAASTIAKKLADELQDEAGDIVGYKIRFANKVKASASVKMMTDGILLAEIQSDKLLSKYDTLIIDEAHERSLNIDFILGYLAEILVYRSDLRLVIMSATINAKSFSDFFSFINSKRVLDDSSLPFLQKIVFFLLLTSKVEPIL